MRDIGNRAVFVFVFVIVTVIVCDCVCVCLFGKTGRVYIF